MTATRRPSHADLVPIAAQAIIGATPVQGALVTALLTYVEITGAYVRSGRSAPVMQEAFDAGVTAIRAAADAMIRESTKSAPGGLEHALRAAIMALRSYQHGNAAPDLARSIADAGDDALRAASLPPATLGAQP